MLGGCEGGKGWGGGVRPRGSLFRRTHVGGISEGGKKCSHTQAHSTTLKCTHNTYSKCTENADFKSIHRAVSECTYNTDCKFSITFQSP